MKHPGGRPTKYKPEYCDQLVTHMASGLSFESFGGVVKVCEDTLYEWEKTHKEFSGARKTGLTQMLLFWEKIGINAALGLIANFSSASWIFNMKNRFKWTDRIEQNSNVAFEPLIIEFEGLDRRQVFDVKKVVNNVRDSGDRQQLEKVPDRGTEPELRFAADRKSSKSKS